VQSISYFEHFPIQANGASGSVKQIRLPRYIAHVRGAPTLTVAKYTSLTADRRWASCVAGTAWKLRYRPQAETSEPVCQLTVTTHLYVPSGGAPRTLGRGNR